MSFREDRAANTIPATVRRLAVLAAGDAECTAIALEVLARLDPDVALKEV